MCHILIFVKKYSEPIHGKLEYSEPIYGKLKCSEPIHGKLE